MSTAIEKLQELIKNDPSNFQARRELAVILANNGFNEEALANLEFLRKYFPEDADLLYNIGIIYEKLKDYKSAKKAYEEAVKISPQADFLYNMGEVMVSLEEWDEAIGVFKEVLKTDPDDGNCYFNLGLCCYKKEELNIAADYFQKAIALNSKDLYAHFYLGEIYQRQGLTNFAADNYRRVLEISPDYSWAYYNLASIAYENGNIDEATLYLMLTIEYNEQDIEAYKLLAKICLKNGDTESILTTLHTRLEKDSNGDLYYVLSQIYKHINKTEEYIENLNNALKNPLTLTYPHDTVKAEFKYAVKNAGDLYDPSGEIEEYNTLESDTKDLEDNSNTETIETEEDYIDEENNNEDA